MSAAGGPAVSRETGPTGRLVARARELGVPLDPGVAAILIALLDRIALEPQNLTAIEGVEVTHAGTAIEDGEIVTAGGRVLNVTALGSTPPDTRPSDGSLHAAN